MYYFMNNKSVLNWSFESVKLKIMIVFNYTNIEQSAKHSVQILIKKTKIGTWWKSWFRTWQFGDLRSGVIIRAENIISSWFDIKSLPYVIHLNCWFCEYLRHSKDTIVKVGNVNFVKHFNVSAGINFESLANQISSI